MRIRVGLAALPGLVVPGLAVMGMFVMGLVVMGAGPQAASVTIDNFAFTPAEVTVAAGTVVTWTNRDDIPHTVTAAETPRAFKSDPLDTGDHFAYRFEHAGRYPYFCSLHAHMQGVVIVN